PRLDPAFKSSGLNELIFSSNLFCASCINSSKEEISSLYNSESSLKKFKAAKTLGETPKFDQDKILNNSLNQSSFEHNFNLADSLDQYFGTNLREELLNKLDQQSLNSQMNLSLESLTKNALANKSWNNLFNKALENAIKEANNKNINFEALKSLSHQIQQLMNSCPNIQCSQKISQKLPDLISQTLEACNTPDQLKNATEFLRKIGLSPNTDDIKRIGEDLGMSEADISELVEPNYQLLKKMVDEKVADFQRISNLINQLQDQLNKERIKELL
ncbi:unnamed protein product, partial [marine sediment metagenome]